MDMNMVTNKKMTFEEVLASEYKSLVEQIEHGSSLMFLLIVKMLAGTSQSSSACPGISQRGQRGGSSSLSSSPFPSGSLFLLFDIY